jgi:signal transduction histidine kinase
MYARGSTCWRCGGVTVGQMAERSVVLLDTSVAVLVGGVIAVAGVANERGHVPSAALVLGLAAAATLVARRRAPGWTLVASGALVQALFYIDTGVGTVAVLAPAVALFSLALTRGRLQQLLGASAAVAAVIAADVLHQGGLSIIHTLGHVGLVAVPLLAAETLRTRRSNVSLLLERLALAERSREQEAQRRAEQERVRIARDIHDVVAHTLTTINVQAATACELLDRNPDHARSALRTIEDASRDAIGELRAVLGVLRSPGDVDPPRVPTPGVQDVEELVGRARDEGVDVRLDVSGAQPARLADAVSVAAYRIVQESLTNARRHAAGASVHVALAYRPRELAVRVENALDEDARRTSATPGVGIVGMTERAVAVGGTLRAAPAATGFRVDARLPYTPEMS